MPLTVPTYLVTSGVQTRTTCFKWDDWNIKDIEEPCDEALISLLATRLSQRAIVAVAIGCAEWLVYRLMALNDEPAPWDYLEAAWAMTVHHRYSNYGSGTGWIEHTESDTDHWTGAARGPVKRALTIIQSTIQALSWHASRNPADYSIHLARSAATLHKLALHVMEDPSLYRQWLSEVLNRLEKAYPRAHGDELGDVVPRSALDPFEAFDIEQTEELVDHFLRHLDPGSNPFLSDVQGMTQHIEDDEEPDFPGVPYRFSLSLDRQVRLASPS